MLFTRPTACTTFFFFLSSVCFQFNSFHDGTWNVFSYITTRPLVTWQLYFFFSSVDILGLIEQLAGF